MGVSENKKRLLQTLVCNIYIHMYINLGFSLRGSLSGPKRRPRPMVSIEDYYYEKPE